MVPLPTTGPGASEAVGTTTRVEVAEDAGTLVSIVGATEELGTAEETAEVVAAALVVATAVVVGSAEEVAASEVDAGVETDMVTPADSQSASAAARAFCWSEALQAPWMHDVELLMKVSLEQAHAKSVKLQEVDEIPVVRQLSEQSGKSLKLWAETMAIKPVTKTATDFILYKKELRDASANECPRH